MGWLRKGTDSYTTGLLLLAAGLTIAGTLVLTLRPRRPREEGAALPAAAAGAVVAAK